MFHLLHLSYGQHGCDFQFMHKYQTEMKYVFRSVYFMVLYLNKMHVCKHLAIHLIL
jgi:hypothetical protein